MCFTSHTLSNTEKQYAQIEKECLAIVTCMNKWHQYLGEELHVADTLSRTALKDSFESEQSDVFRIELVEMDLKPSNVTADTLERIRTETSKDPVLSILNSVTMTGWLA